MEANNILEKDIGNVLSGAGRLASDEMGGFGETVHKDGDGIILSLGLG